MPGEEVSQTLGAGVRRAGEAALNLARFARQVNVLFAGPGEFSTATSPNSSAAGNIAVRLQTEVVSVSGNGHLAATVADFADATKQWCSRNGGSRTARRRTPTGSAPSGTR